MTMTAANDLQSPRMQPHPLDEPDARRTYLTAELVTVVGHTAALIALLGSFSQAWPLGPGFLIGLATVSAAVPGMPPPARSDAAAGLPPVTPRATSARPATRSSSRAPAHGSSTPTPTTPPRQPSAQPASRHGSEPVSLRSASGDPSTCPPSQSA